MTANRAPQPAATRLPTTNQLLQISAKLKDKPIPKVLSCNPQIPRILLTAAKRGIDDDAAEISGTKAMVDSLLALSKASIISKKRNQHTRNPSPFTKTRAAKLSNNEMETITRAATWATKLLTDCIRGTPPESQSDPSRIVHTDTTTVFVAPRDTLDPLLAQRYASQATKCLTHPFFRRNLSALANVQAFLTSTAAVSSHHANLCLPVLERALHTFASAPCPLHVSEKPSRTFDIVLAQSSASLSALIQPLSQLPPEAKGALCVQSPLSRDALRTHVEKQFASEKMMLDSIQREMVNPLARAAVIDVNLHWEVMDHVRAVVSGPDAPFSLHLWNERRFFRALLSETIRLLEKDHNHEMDLVTRFPPFGRPLVRLLSALSCSMQSQDIRRQRTAVSVATNLIWKMLNMGEDIIWTPNVHALMICAESLLELFCWATTFSLDLGALESTPPRKRKQGQQGDPLTCVCYLSALSETSRLPGGELIETSVQIQSIAFSMRGFLLRISRQRQFDVASAFRGNRIGGLGAFAVSGILGHRSLAISVKSCGNVPPVHNEHFCRSLQKSAPWTTDATIRSRYERYLKMMVETVSGSKE